MTVWFHQCSFDPTYLNRTNLMIECHIRTGALEIFCSNLNCSSRYALVILLHHFLRCWDWWSVTSHAVIYLVSKDCSLCQCSVQHHQSFLASCFHQLESSWWVLIYRGFSHTHSYSLKFDLDLAVQQDWYYARRSPAKMIAPSELIAIHPFHVA